ncbi:MAG: transketolase [Actinomycetaceae bacterium]|nr:transketolase [Actinomycetaceae bacterium]
MLYPPTDREPWIGRIDRDSPADLVNALKEAANEIRKRDLRLVHEAGAGHIGGSLGAADILTTLYLHSLNVAPERVDDPERDRFILSKGHIAGMLYVVLAARGFIDPEELPTFLQPESDLNGHPSRTKVAAVEANTGPLGHGLPIAAGHAMAARLDGSPRRTFVLTGDGELQEGSNWEALMFAGHQKLGNLTVIIDRNRLQQGARVAETNTLEPLADKLAAFNFEVIEVNGNEIAELLEVFDAPTRDGAKPRAVIAHTNKGHPISFMSDNVAWHHKVPSDEQYAQAMEELEAIS